MWDRPDAKAALDEIENHYHLENGVFIWKTIKPKQSRRKVGDVAGWEILKQGKNYWTQYVCGVKIKRAHLVWLAHHKDWPKGPVYHRNGNPLDDRIENLSLEKPLSFGRHKGKLYV